MALPGFEPGSSVWSDRGFQRAQDQLPVHIPSSQLNSEAPGIWETRERHTRENRGLWGKHRAASCVVYSSLKDTLHTTSSDTHLMGPDGSTRSMATPYLGVFLDAAKLWTAVGANSFLDPSLSIPE